jgi:hypothetical protein
MTPILIGSPLVELPLPDEDPLPEEPPEDPPEVPPPPEVPEVVPPDDWPELLELLLPQAARAKTSRAISKMLNTFLMINNPHFLVIKAFTFPGNPFLPLFDHDVCFPFDHVCLTNNYEFLFLRLPAARLHPLSSSGKT